MVTMSAPSRLHDITLAHIGGKTGARASAHNVHNNARDLGHTGKAEIFLHEREARAAGCRHRFRARKGSPDDGSQAGNFVFHLNEGAPRGRQSVRHDLADLSGRGNGIPRKKAAPGSERAFDDGLIALQQELASSTFRGDQNGSFLHDVK